MLYSFSIALSLACFVVAVALTFYVDRAYKSTRLLTPSRVLAVGVFFSSWVLLFPYYYNDVFSKLSTFPRIWESVWVTVHHVIRFFVAGADFSDLQTASKSCGIPFYYQLGTVLLVMAPLLTFSVVLSFFRNFSSYRKYLMHPNAATYVFSELNEKSLNLAKDLKQNHPRAVVVFTDVFEDADGQGYDIVERAKEFGAICFKKDILSINFSLHSRSSLLCFFLMAEERSMRGVQRQITSATTPEEENLKLAHRIVNTPFYANRPNTRLFVFSSSTQGEILIENLPVTRIDVRRVDKFSPLILRTLHTSGKEMLFDTAVDNENGEKEINAVIVGAGGYGTEMIRNLLWYCQMDGYRLSIDVFDEYVPACDEFEFTCPAIMDEKNNGIFDVEDIPRYSVRFHTGISVKTRSFAEALSEIRSPTYVLVALGSDELNVETAIAIRRICRQAGCARDPFIHAIVYDTDNKKGIECAKNYKQQQYGISYIGDLAETFSEAVIINEDLEKEAMKTYAGYVGLFDRSGEIAFMKSNLRRSSILEALSKELCVKMGSCGVGASTSDEEKLRYAMLYHVSWMARMYSMGYVYGEVRDDIAKTHPLLIPFKCLPYNEQLKLSSINNR